MCNRGQKSDYDGLMTTYAMIDEFIIEKGLVSGILANTKKPVNVDLKKS